LRAQDISHFAAVSQHIKNLDEAQAAKQEFEAESHKRRAEIAHTTTSEESQPSP
jgi:hypothetical protein